MATNSSSPAANAGFPRPKPSIRLDRLGIIPEMLWDTAAFSRTYQIDGAKNILNERIDLLA
jgi:hypothetical protein